MPLRAFLNGQEIISLEYSDSEWTELKDKIKKNNNQLTLPCCNQAGFLRTSIKGLKHFVHAKSGNVCDWKPETPEHLRSKIEIVKACHENDWKAIPEFSEKDWRADVLAIKNEMRIAFEVQWSKQTMEDTKFRQQRYKESNVRGCWFFRTLPKVSKFDSSILVDKEIPSFEIHKDEIGEIMVNFTNDRIPLKDFVTKLLKRNIKHCEHYRLQPKQEVEIVIYETSCWKCKKLQHGFTVDQHLKTICNKDMYLMGSMWDGDDIDKHPVILSAVKEIMKSEKDIKIGQVKRRYSKTIESSYLSNGCYYCDVIFGDFYLSSEKLDGLHDSNSRTFKRTLDLGIIKQEGQHWCHSTTNEFCE